MSRVFNGRVTSFRDKVADIVEKANPGEDRGLRRAVLAYVGHAIGLRVLHDVVWSPPDDGTYRVEPAVIIRAIDHTLELRHGRPEGGYPSDEVRRACWIAYDLLEALSNVDTVRITFSRDGPYVTVTSPRYLGLLLELVLERAFSPFTRVGGALIDYDIKPPKERIEEGVRAVESWANTLDGDFEELGDLCFTLEKVVSSVAMRFELRPFPSFDVANVKGAERLVDAKIPFVRVEEGDAFPTVRVEDVPAFFAFLIKACKEYSEELGPWHRSAALARRALAPRNYRPPVTRNPQVVREFLRVVMEERSREDSEEREE